MPTDSELKPDPLIFLDNILSNSGNCMAGLKSNLHLSVAWHEAIWAGRGQRNIALVNIYKLAEVSRSSDTDAINCEIFLCA